MGIGAPSCLSCGTDMLPLLIPPLLNKPISDRRIIRSIWSLARQRLDDAGFSAPPTDFYAAWLLCSTVGVRDNVEIIVVNPGNDEAEPTHADFARRMGEIFPRGFNSRFLRFSEIAEILAAVCRSVIPRDADHSGVIPIS